MPGWCATLPVLVSSKVSEPIWLDIWVIAAAGYQERPAGLGSRVCSFVWVSERRKSAHFPLCDPGGGGARRLSLSLPLPISDLRCPVHSLPASSSGSQTAQKGNLGGRGSQGTLGLGVSRRTGSSAGGDHRNSLQERSCAGPFQGCAHKRPAARSWAQAWVVASAPSCGASLPTMSRSK